MKKVSVGIISHYYKNDNYGGMLQAYALCRFLNSDNVEARQISYNMADKSFAYRSWFYKFLRRSFRVVKKWARDLRHISISFKLNKRRKTLQKFRNSIPHTKVYDLKTIRKCDEFDVYVAGSDQVWNPSWYDDAFLLNFVGEGGKVKCSYAASIGKNKLTDENKSQFSNALNSYAAISVREESAVGLLQGLVDKTIDLVLDPTLLLSRNEWESICSGEYPEGKYVFCYFLGDNIQQRNLAIEYAKEKHCELVSVPYLNGEYRKADSEMECTKVYDMSPRRFLQLIKNAACVFTDSFHASVFSHIFQRDFFVFVHGGASVEMSNRLYTLSEMFETKDRICDSTEKKDIQYLLNSKPINYDKEFSKFEQIKARSIAFLKDNITKRACD